MNNLEGLSASGGYLQHEKQVPVDLGEGKEKTGVLKYPLYFKLYVGMGAHQPTIPSGAQKDQAEIEEADTVIKKRCEAMKQAEN